MPNPSLTKRIMAQAMKQLMSEKPLAKISVGDIAERCELNRNSFYYHFKDKYDLVNWIFTTEVVQALGDADLETASSLEILGKFCSYIYDNRDFYTNALSVEGQNSLSEHLNSMMKELIYLRVDNLDENDEYSVFFANFITDAYLSSLFRWINDGARVPPEQFIDMLKKALEHIATVTVERID